MSKEKTKSLVSEEEQEEVTEPETQVEEQEVEVGDEVVKAISDKVLAAVNAGIAKKTLETETVAKKALGEAGVKKSQKEDEGLVTEDVLRKMVKDLAVNQGEKTIEFSPRQVKAVKAIDRLNNDQIAMKGLMTTTSDDVSDTIPAEDFVAEIGRYEKRYGLALQDVNTRRTSNPNLTVIQSNTDLTFSETAEATDYTNVTLDIQKLTISMKKYGGYALFTEEQLEDSSTDLLRESSQQGGRALSKAKENWIFNHATYGLLNISGTNEVIASQGNGATFASMEYADLVDMITGIHDATGAKFYMNRAVWGVVMKMVDGDNRPLVGFPGVQNAVTPSLLGYPVVLVEVMPSVTALDTGFIVFGNLDNYQLGVRNEMQVKVLTEGRLTISGTDYDLGHQGLVAIRMSQRFAGAARFANAFSVLRTATSS